ncbi:tyrosine-type recombinase/integrase [Xylanibacter caecicola]|uniref:tyrosine-type recombinase/integrase n=1 Tax=Xylanibacter caecicola TaxID=2736294 RepID=UPI00258E6DD5|nr:tyrosine-type recombinase/integrase [Xylanibacter caecicola]
MMIEQFLNYLLLEKNNSEQTVRNYGLDLRLFESYFKKLDARLSWESVDSDIIRDWMESMMDRGNNATSINRRLSALRSFYRFALSRNLVGSDPAHGITGPKKSLALPRFVKDNEINSIIDSFSEEDHTYNNMCARAILLMFYWTGMRVSELISLDDSSVDIISCNVKVVGKGNKHRLVPFGGELKRCLNEYIAVRDACVERTDNALFVTDKGKRMGYYRVRKLVDEHLSKVCTLDKKTPHVLRHSYATAMLNNGAGIESVKKLLGHSSVATTEIYTHVTFEKLKEVYETAHPRS